MLGKNNQFMNQKKSGRKFEKYSIKKLKVGAASVLVGAGFFLGFHVEASEVNEPITNEVVSALAKEQKEKASEAPKVVAANEEKANPSTPSVDNKLVEEKNTNITTEKVTSTEEQPTDEKKAKVETSQLLDKMTALQEQVNRIRSNEKQKSFIEKAEKLLEEAKSLQNSSSATQPEVDKKAKEISSLTSILKSIKAEETPKENKNQDSRNGKKMEEGTGFRTGVTNQALTGSIHFDTSTGPTEKQIPVANNGDGERVINLAISYSASSTETVTDGKVRVTIPKEFLHSTKKPEFANSSFVKSVDDLSTITNYVYDLNLNPMSGGTVAESLLKLYVGTSIKNAPSKGDVLSVNTDFIAGGQTLSTKSARASFDYLSEILYREKEWRTKTVKYMVDQFGAPLPEFKMGSVSNGTFKPIEGNTFRLPFIMSDQSFFNNQETEQNGNGRLTSYDYTISGIPDFLELDPTNIKNNKFWTLENGVLTLHPDENKGIDQSLLYGGPILKVKEGAFNTPEAIERAIESNSTKGFNANIVYKAVGHRPDGSTFTQTLDNPDGFRLYLGDGIPAIKEMDTRIFPETNQ
ncbi:YSIRK-type signal peptide-containing protein, partial [Granulicatella sp.]